MSKTSNTVWFLLGAIILNLLLMVIFMVGGYVLLAFIYKGVETPGNGIAVLMFLFFFGAIALSWFVYSKIVKWLVEKHHLEDKISPIFSSKRGKSQRQKKERIDNMSMKN
ncbi:MAG: hypothetical protein WC162_00200 [Sphaerochaetaceae bacterium]